MTFGISIVIQFIHFLITFYSFYCLAEIKQLHTVNKHYFYLTKPHPLASLLCSYDADEDEDLEEESLEFNQMRYVFTV